MRIQLLSRHIENMQRICRSHLEMTRHRRQVSRHPTNPSCFCFVHPHYFLVYKVYRLQQIRRILEDLREQIRYLQVCVRDSLDRLRTTPSSPDSSGPSNGSNSISQSPAVERPSQSSGNASSSSAAGGSDLSQFSATGRVAVGSRGYSPVQCRRFAHYLVGRLRRIGLQQHREYPRLHRSSFREGRGPLR